MFLVITEFLLFFFAWSRVYSMLSIFNTEKLQPYKQWAGVTEIDSMCIDGASLL